MDFLGALDLTSNRLEGAATAMIVQALCQAAAAATGGGGAAVPSSSSSSSSSSAAAAAAAPSSSSSSGPPSASPPPPPPPPRLLSSLGSLSRAMGAIDGYFLVVKGPMPYVPRHLYL